MYSKLCVSDYITCEGHLTVSKKKNKKKFILQFQQRFTWQLSTYSYHYQPNLLWVRERTFRHCIQTTSLLENNVYLYNKRGNYWNGIFKPTTAKERRKGNRIEHTKLDNKDILSDLHTLFHCTMSPLLFLKDKILPLVSRKN